MTNETYLPDTIKPRYDLTNDEIKQYENEIAGIINEQLCEDHLGVCAVWIDSSSKYADIIRTYEKSFVDDINEIMVDHESRSLFLAIVDMRGSSPRVARVSRLSCPPASEDATVGEGKTGIALVDDVIDSGQGLDATEFHEFYKDKGVDLTRCLSVETNKKVFRAEHYKGLPLAQIGYLAIFHKLEQLRAGEPSYIFAAVNSESVRSFELIGLQYEALAGRSDLKVPISAGEFDEDYMLVALPTTSENVAIFKQIESLGAPSVVIE